MDPKIDLTSENIQQELNNILTSIGIELEEESLTFEQFNQLVDGIEDLLLLEGWSEIHDFYDLQILSADIVELVTDNPVESLIDMDTEENEHIKIRQYTNVTLDNRVFLLEFDERLKD